MLCWAPPPPELFAAIADSSCVTDLQGIDPLVDGRDLTGGETFSGPPSRRHAPWAARSFKRACVASLIPVEGLFAIPI